MHKPYLLTHAWPPFQIREAKAKLWKGYRHRQPGYSPREKQILARGIGGLLGTEKVIATEHDVVSEGGKTMRMTIKGKDAQGKPYETLELFDRM